MDTLVIDAFQSVGLFVGSVCLTKFADQPSAKFFQEKLAKLGIKSYRHYKIPGYPSDVEKIVSDEGYGKNDYIETERPLVVITAPGPGSGTPAAAFQIGDRRADSLPVSNGYKNTRILYQPTRRIATWKRGDSPVQVPSAGKNHVFFVNFAGRGFTFADVSCTITMSLPGRASFFSIEAYV